jgi:hypothetical protein
LVVPSKAEVEEAERELARSKQTYLMWLLTYV